MTATPGSLCAAKQCPAWQFGFLTFWHRDLLTLHNAGSDPLPGRKDHWRGVQGSRRGHGAVMSSRQLLVSQAAWLCSCTPRRGLHYKGAVRSPDTECVLAYGRLASTAGRRTSTHTQPVASEACVRHFHNLKRDRAMSGTKEAEMAVCSGCNALWLASRSNQHLFPGFYLRRVKDLCTADIHPHSTACSTSVAVITAWEWMWQP